MAREDEDLRSLCRSLKAIWDKRVEKGEIEISRDKRGKRIITIR